MNAKTKDALKLLVKMGGIDKEILTHLFMVMLKDMPVTQGDKASIVDKIVDMYLVDDSYLDHTLNLAKMYGSFYTHAEIKELLAFYDTPIGKKVIKNAPLVAQGSISTGAEWHQQTKDKFTPKIMDILKEYGCY